MVPRYGIFAAAATVFTLAEAQSDWPAYQQFNYYGCWSDASGAQLNTTKASVPGATMTIKSCLDACSGFNYAGLEGGSDVRKSRSFLLEDESVYNE